MGCGGGMSKNRVEIEKYCHVAPLSEVAENEYNLNIPRYVDTFEEEETIDLDKVSSELKALEIEMKTTDETIASFCRELNISTPFLEMILVPIASIPKSDKRYLLSNILS